MINYDETTISVQLDPTDPSTTTTIQCALAEGLVVSIAAVGQHDGEWTVQLTGDADAHDAFVYATGFECDENDDGSWSYQI